MIANWVHIIIVHLPVLVTPWLAYRVWAFDKTSLDGKEWKWNFSGLIILALLTTLAYFTGPDAAEYIKGILDTYPQDQVENHALWGRVAFVIQVILGIMGVMGWASILQEEIPDRRIARVVFILLLINILVLLYTAHLGGMIRRMDLVLG